MLGRAERTGNSSLIQSSLLNLSLNSFPDDFVFFVKLITFGTTFVSIDPCPTLDAGLVICESDRVTLTPAILHRP